MNWLKLAAGGLVIAVLVMAQCERQRANRDIGKWQEIAKRLQSDSADAANTIRRVDSVFTHDTLRLRSVLNRYVTLRDTISLTDTVQVREFVTRADTAIRACVEALGTCQQRVAARDSLITVLGEQRQADQRLFSARLRAANPRVLPYTELLTSPLDPDVLVARGGAELRVFGPLRLVGALEYHTHANRPLSALVGVRVTF